MCLYDYQNKLINNNSEYDEEFLTLKSIYKYIDDDNIQKSKELTSKLISIQTDKNKIDILKNYLNNN